MSNTNTILLVLILVTGAAYVYQNSVAQQVTVIRGPGWGQRRWGGWGQHPWGGRGRHGGHRGRHHL